ncbi:MAG: TIGR03936 family radical SAM-associated protein, partial [Clostridiales bacterium]|nr:TIGR03936 family radical SAM-associated protein [Clostridiales bacterium]
MARCLACFKKTGAMVFIGHLDLLKVLQRAVARANLPVAFSQGFNPHQEMSFALPLPLGMEGLGELVEIEFAQPLETDLVVSSLNKSLPSGLSFTDCRFMADGEKHSASLVAAAEYELEANSQAEEKLAELMSKPEILVMKRTKKGTSEVDIKPDIFSAMVSDGTLKMTLAAGGARNLKAEVVAKEL